MSAVQAVQVGRCALRLWWRCALCRWRVDTFGMGHGEDRDRLAMGIEVLDHLAERHGLVLFDLGVAADLFEPAGSVRPRKRHVLVDRR